MYHAEFDYTCTCVLVQNCYVSLIYFMRLCCTFYLYFVYFDSSAMIPPPPLDELMLDLNPYDVCALVSLQKENICIRN